MTHPPTPVPRPQRALPWLAAVGAALVVATPALASRRDDAAVNLARYQRESAVCTSGQSNQSRADCLREARSAYAEARRGKLGEGLPADAANLTARCRPLPADDRRDCEARMHGQGTQSGSVASGGVFRELVTIEPATPRTTIVVPSRDPPADRPAPVTPEHPPSR